MNAPRVGGARRAAGKGALAGVAVASIRAYRVTLAPHLVGACRYVPTCSQYAEEAVLRFGVWRGGRMALARLARCNPFHQGGYDPVPERVSR